MDQSTALSDLLLQRGYRRHGLERNSVGHLQLTGQLDGERIDILVDTGAASTVVDLGWCRSHRVPLLDTGRLGGGAGGVTMPIYSLGPVPLLLDGVPLRSDGIFALDMSHVNAGLKMKGAGRVEAVLGADVLSHHEAVIDYATGSLFLRDPAR
jgi:hypothetical protein